MKEKSKKTALWMSKLLLCGLLLQLFLVEALYATDSYAQSDKSVYDIHISLSKSKYKLEDILKEIEGKTDFHFTYDDSKVRLSSSIWLDRKEGSLGAILVELSKLEGIKFKRIGKNIHISRKKEAETSITEQAMIIRPTLMVKGIVTSRVDGVGLPGVNVLVKGTSTGTVTDVEGNYSINVPNEDDVLVFSSIGYITQEVPVNGRTTIDIALAEDVQSLKEVVVVGYGTQSKRNVTSSIGSVSSEEIENYPVQQMGQALQGKVAGIQIIQNSGSPGSSLMVRIRGTGTVNNSEPLYVIDGNLGADPNDLDPNHIESIEVLKSASAAAIYGAQGANGVVMITTKKGIQGTPNLQLDFYNGFQQVHNTLPMMNARQFATIYNQALTNAGRAPLFTNVESLGEGTDWQDAIFRTAPIQNVGFSVNGGTEQATYYISGSYFQQKGIVIESDYSRLNFRVNSEYKANSAISFGENLSLSYAVRNDIPEFGSRNPVPNSWHMDPTTPVKNPDGSWGFPKFSDTKNPVAEAILYNSITKKPVLNGSAYLDIKPWNNLVYRSQINMNIGFSNGYQFTPTYDVFPLQRNLVTEVSRTAYQRTNWDWQNTLTFEIAQGPHDIEVLGGVTVLSNHSENIFATGQGVPENANTDPNLRYLDLANIGQQVSGGAGEFGMLSFLGRVNYSYKGTYLFTGNFRADGSSKFGSNNRFGTFPSFSAGWRISDENFMTMVRQNLSS